MSDYRARGTYGPDFRCENCGGDGPRPYRKGVCQNCYSRQYMRRTKGSKPRIKDKVTVEVVSNDERNRRRKLDSQGG